MEARLPALTREVGRSLEGMKPRGAIVAWYSDPSGHHRRRASRPQS